MRITIDDVRRHYCTRGARRWFEQHGLDFRDFLAQGIDAEAFVAAGDDRAAHIVAAKSRELAMAADMRLTLRDIAPHFCRDGVRAWCRRHGLDYALLLDEGLPVADMLATNDPKVQRVLAAKLREVAA